MSPFSPIRPFLAAALALLTGGLVVPHAASAVVGGNYGSYVTKAADGDYPWAVSVTIRGGGPSDAICGGTLIAKNRILTAAHCIDPGGTGQATADAIEVLVGQTSRVATGCTTNCGSSDYARRIGLRLRVQAISLHAKTDIVQVGDTTLDHFYYDVAQLTLAEELPSPYWPAIVTPVASSGENQVDLTGTEGYAFPATSPTADAWGPETSANDGVDTFVFGWGATQEGGNVQNVMRRGGGNMMERLSDAECAARYLGEPFRSEDMLCVGRSNYRASPVDYSPDACQGDSGGPLLKRAPEQDYPVLPNTGSDGVEGADAWSIRQRDAMTAPELAAAKSQTRAELPVSTINAWRGSIRAAVEAETPQPADVAAEVEQRLEASIQAFVDEDLVGTPEKRGFLYRERLKREHALQHDSYDLEGRHWRLVGVVSWGIGCGDPDRPGVYARVGAPAIREYVTNPSPVAMPYLAPRQLGPAPTGVFTPGSTISCSPGGVVSADTYVYSMWRDVNGDGSRGATDRTLTTNKASYSVTSDDINRLSSRDIASGVRIGCTVKARSAGGYATFSGPVTSIPVDPKRPTPAPIDPPGTNPTPAPAPAVDRAAPLLSKRAAVCSTRSCRVSVLAVDRGEASTGVQGVTATLTIARRAKCRAKSGKYEGRLRPCIKTTKRSVKPMFRSGEWVVVVKRLRSTDRVRLQFTSTDHAGNASALLLKLRLRASR